MKTTILSAIISLFAFSLNAQSCKDFIQEEDMSSMLGYDCESVKVAEMYSGDEAVISQPIEANKRYKIKVLKAEYLGDYNLEIVDRKDRAVSMKVANGEETYFQVVTEKATELKLHLNLEKTRTLTGLQRSGCVAVLVGSMENTELASTKIIE